MWVTNEKKILLLLRQFHENFLCKTPRKLSIFPEMRNDDLMHREGSKGY